MIKQAGGKVGMKAKKQEDQNTRVKGTPAQISLTMVTNVAVIWWCSGDDALVRTFLALTLSCSF